MRKDETAPERLARLLPWLNEEPMSATVIRRELEWFVESFDGSESAGYIEVERRETNKQNVSIPEWLLAVSEPPLPRYTDPLEDPDERPDPNRPSGLYEDVYLNLLRQVLVSLLREGFSPDSVPVAMQMPATSLVFGIRGVRRRAKMSSLPGAAGRRAYQGPGAYLRTVQGRLDELTYYLVTQLLTMPRMVRLSWCSAPAAWNPKEHCGRFVVGQGKGRPPEFCSTACRVRTNYAKKRDDQERTRRVRRRATRRRKP